MAYVVTHSSPVRYHIQGADDDSSAEVDEEKARKCKKESEIAKLFSDKANVFELEVKFTNVFQKALPVKKQVMSATKARFDPVEHKIICTFAPNEPIFFSYKHQARYSKVTLLLKTADGIRTPLEIVTTYIDCSSDADYNVSSQTLHFRANLEKITDAMKKTLEGDSRKPPAKRKLDFGPSDCVPNVPSLPMPMMFPQPGAPQILDAYICQDNVKYGAIYYLKKAKFELTTSQD